MDKEPLSRMKSPLDWWKKEGYSFPRLAPIARRVLSVPASLASSERAFSAGGLITCQQRASLSPANLDAIVFLNKNMPFLFNMDMSTNSPLIEQEPAEEPAEEQVGEAGQQEGPELPSLPDSWEDF